MVDDESAEDRFDFAKFMQLDVSDIERQMHDAADLTVNQIRVEAAQAMSPDSHTEYMKSVSVTEVSASGFVVELRGMVANIIEQGLGPNGIGSYTGSLFDMRPSILKPGTRNLRFTKDGAMYVNVPFHKTLGMVRQLGTEAGRMGAAAVRAAKALAPTRTDPAGLRPTQWGGRLGAGFGPQKAHWATDALKGLVRFETTYSAAQGGTQPTHATWRRITELGHGNDAAWWSKGVEPRAIFDKVVAKIDGILAMAGL